MWKGKHEMKKNKKIFSIFAIVVAMLAGIVTNKAASVSSELKNVAMSACYGLDIYNPAELVGDADYVFVGQVKSIDGTIYKNKMWLPQQNGTMQYIGDPFTKYTVRVLENLKNNLAVDKNVSIIKYGGISEDGSVCQLMERDFLPQEGKIYIFIAYVEEDGSLSILGENSNIEIKEKKKSITDKSQVKNTEVYQTYKKAVKNQIESERQRYWRKKRSNK